MIYQSESILFLVYYLFLLDLLDIQSVIFQNVMIFLMKV